MSGVNLFTSPRAHLMNQAVQHADHWGYGQELRWDADLNQGLIEFTMPNNVLARAPIQIAGTYNAAEGSFMWADANDSIPQPLTQLAQQCRRWLGEQNMAELANDILPCAEDDGWNLAALVNQLGNGNGVYRGPVNNVMVFMVLGDITLHPLSAA